MLTIHLVTLANLPNRIISLREAVCCELPHNVAVVILAGGEELPGRGSRHVSMNYEFHGQTVADTLWSRHQKGDSRVSATQESGRLVLQTSPPGSETLFCLRTEGHGARALLCTAWGEQAQVSPSHSPDPLWESAEGICRHMDSDHADTYSQFLQMNGVAAEPEATLWMPWVEERGFFIQEDGSQGSRFHWIPFPQGCPTPNDVRKTLILMLRGIRNE